MSEGSLGFSSSEKFKLRRSCSYYRRGTSKNQSEPCLFSIQIIMFLIVFFLFLAEQYWRCEEIIDFFLNHSLFEEHLDSIQFCAIINKTVVNFLCKFLSENKVLLVWNISLTGLRGKCAALNIYIREEKRSQINV